MVVYLYYIFCFILKYFILKINYLVEFYEIEVNKCCVKFYLVIYVVFLMNFYLYCMWILYLGFISL